MSNLKNMGWFLNNLSFLYQFFDFALRSLAPLKMDFFGLNYPNLIQISQKKFQIHLAIGFAIYTNQ